MTRQNFTTVAVIYSAEEAQIAKSFLLSNGIDATLPHEHALAMMPEVQMGMGGYRLDVPTEQAVAAKALLPRPDKNPFPACQRCGSTALRRIRNWQLPAFMWFIGFLAPFAPATDQLKCRRCGLVQMDPDDVRAQAEEEPA